MMIFVAVKVRHLLDRLHISKLLTVYLLKPRRYMKCQKNFKKIFLSGLNRSSDHFQSKVRGVFQFSRIPIQNVGNGNGGFLRGLKPRDKIQGLKKKWDRVKIIAYSVLPIHSS